MEKQFTLKIWMNVNNKDVIKEDLAWNLGIIASQIEEFNKTEGRTEEFSWALRGNINDRKDE